MLSITLLLASEKKHKKVHFEYVNISEIKLHRCVGNSVVMRYLGDQADPRR